MKALRWYGKKDIRYEDTVDPVAGPGQLKVKIKLAGICGTDLKEYVAGPVMIAADSAPITVGHEFVGEVVELGSGVNGFSVGDKVTGLCHWYCNDCTYCRKGMFNLCLNTQFTGLTKNGCMAEYMVAPSNTFYKLPQSVSDEEGALVEPLSVALHAVRLGKVQLGDKVGIIGDGTIGLCALLAARAAGASEVYLVAKYRKRGKKGLEMGAKKVFYISEGSPAKDIIEHTEGLGVDVAIECVGQAKTPQLTVDVLRRNGTAVIVGVFGEPSLFHFGSLVFNQINVVGSPIYVDEAKAVIPLLADKRIEAKGLVTAKVSLKDGVEKGFDKLINEKEENLKILLEIQ